MKTIARTLLIAASPLLLVIYWRNELRDLTQRQNQNTDEDMALLLMNNATTL